jgi:hypothetical protein
MKGDWGMVEISFCDEVSVGQFGKINLMGWNPTDPLTIPQIPYTLFSTLVIKVSFGPRESTADLVFTIKQNDASGRMIFEESHPIANINRDNPDEDLSLFFVQPLVWEIKTYGTIRIAVCSCSDEVGAESLRVEQGPAPISGLARPIISSGLLAEGKGYILDAILKSANQNLVLIDQFLNIDDLMDLLNSVPSQVAIRVLTRPDSRNEYLKRRSEGCRMAESIDIRFSRKIHDRYVIVNGTEYFHFGYSLKDLWRGRVSRYAKIYRKDEIDDLTEVFESEWRVAEVL